MTTPDFFFGRLDAMVDQRHPLVVLAGKLAWDRIEQALAPKFVHQEPPAYLCAPDLAPEPAAPGTTDKDSA